MAFKIYIDTFLTDQPINDMELVTTIRRDSTLGGFLITQDVTLKYPANNAPATGEISGYSYLKSLFNSGTCNTAEIVIYGKQSVTDTYRVYTGVIAVPSVSIQEQEVSLTCKIDDNGFYSYIKNNQNVKYNLYTNRTKNNELITPPQIYETDMFWSASGVYGSTIGIAYRGYRLYDVLKFIVPAISDNKVTFESDFLQEDNQLFIFNGSALSFHDTNPDVNVSFGEIVKELFKLKNVSFYIDQTDPDAPVLRLEQADWFFLGSTILTFDDVFKLTTSIKNEKIFGTVNVGAFYNPGGADPIYTFNSNTSYFGWKEEVYTPYGQCNTDTSLDLVNDWGITSNAINYQIGGAATTDMDKIFIVECDTVDTALFTAKAVRYEIYGNGVERFYNIGLNNVNKIGNHNGNFQSALTNTQANGDDICHITLGVDTKILDQNGGSGLQSTFSTPAIVIPIIFADEFGGDNYDPGGNYNNVSGYYTAPIAGDYSFLTTLEVESANLKSCVTPNNTILQANGFPSTNIDTQYAVDLTIGIVAYEDNTFANIIGTQTQTYRITANGTFTYTASLPIALPINGVVRVGVSSQFLVLFPTIFGNTPLSALIRSGGLCGYLPTEPKVQFYVMADSTFECNGTPDGGLILAPPDPTAYKIRLHEFDYDLTTEQFRLINATPIGQFEFIKGDITRIGWIEELQYNNWTGRTKVKLISQDATV